MALCYEHDLLDLEPIREHLYNKSWSVHVLENQEVTEQEAETDGREDEREQM